MRECLHCGMELPVEPAHEPLQMLLAASMLVQRFKMMSIEAKERGAIYFASRIDEVLNEFVADSKGNTKIQLK